MKRTIEIEIKVCNFCGYEWTPLKKEPKQCPSCKRYFQKENKMEKKKC